MPYDDQQKQTIMQWIQDKFGGEPQCLACGQKRARAGTIFDGHNAQPTLPLECVNCGHVSFFMAAEIGLA